MRPFSEPYDCGSISLPMYSMDFIAAAELEAKFTQDFLAERPSDRAANRFLTCLELPEVFLGMT